MGFADRVLLPHRDRRGGRDLTRRSRGRDATRHPTVARPDFCSWQSREGRMAAPRYDRCEDMIGIPLGLLYANALEWALHKYVLHGLGRKKGSFFSFHWHDHHKSARKHGMLDEAYRRPLRDWNPQTKELVGLLGLAVLHAPLVPIFPIFSATLGYSAIHYYRAHKRAHLDAEWAREHLPWHVDHHMGPNQDANWCVTRPWFDWIMGTRVKGAASQATAFASADMR
jgi:hypothetical protein